MLRYVFEKSVERVISEVECLKMMSVARFGISDSSFQLFTSARENL
jgi:hypothetical protein